MRSHGNDIGVSVAEEGSADIMHSEIENNTKGIANRGDVSSRYNRIRNNQIGIESVRGSSLRVSETELNNRIADIVYHKEIPIEVIDTYAKVILKNSPTRGLRPALPGDLRFEEQARTIQNTDDENEKRERFEELFSYATKGGRRIGEGIITNIGVDLLRDLMFEYISKDQLPDPDQILGFLEHFL